ncbi:hybrid sensor histidine kinase/response regulator [Clostridium sp. MCC353]|uniref:hybrid sensor histidine kinase/response regulator n=1 Tax=Clostridium sp. MCC353 TaxID=2592646 RepID=UPI001C01970C|nr:hybrid sensor histidine kinase/response regulator [Clostridium sp. MCC353]
MKTLNRESKNLRSLMRWLRITCIILVIFDLTTTVLYSISAMKKSSLDTIARTESQISEYIRSVWNLGNAVAAAPATRDSTLSLRQRARMLIPYADAYDLFMLGITNQDGLLGSTLERSQITSTEMLNNEGVGNLSSRPAFQEMMATGKSILTDTYPAGADGTTMIYTIWIPYYMDDGIAGAITVSIKFDFINGIITGKSLEDNYYFTLLDSGNQISANPDQELVGKTLEEAYGKSKWVSVRYEQLDENLKSGRAGEYWGVNNDRLEYVTYMPISGTPWKLVMRTDFFGSFRSTFISLAVKVAAYLSLLVLFSLRKNRELVTRERLFNMMTGNVDEIFMAYNMNRGKMEYVSSNVFRVMGISAREWTENEERINAVFQEYADKTKEESGGGIYIDREMYNPETRETHPFRFRIYKFTEEGVNWAVLVITDETEEQKKKKALQAALVSVEKASHAKSEFLTNMSHDIRTPMNAVIGMAEIASANLDDREKLEECLKKINFSGKYLVELIDSVLDMAKIESGSMELRRGEFDLVHQLKELHERFMDQADLKQIRLRLEIGEISHSRVVGDRNRFNQIMAQLVDNALKYTEEGGKVCITAEEETCEKEGEGLYRIVVSDNGIGMEEDFLKRIFEPFERAESSTISKTMGTGLGMSIVKRLVGLMDGTVHVESVPGEGSRFTVCIPLEWAAAGKEPALAARELSREDKEPDLAARELSREDKEPDLAARELIQEDPVRNSSYRILLVEDNELNMEIMRELLGMAGFITDEACNGEEAVKKFQESPISYYSMIITDIHMPGVNGYEEAGKIRNLEREDAASVPIIAMTADATLEGRRKAAEAGMNGYITKPVEMGLMMETIHKLLETEWR